jgi:hypothetical protein
MAGETRPAAGYPIYEVHELVEGEPPVELGLRATCFDYESAADVVFDLLQAEGGVPDGHVVEIVRVAGGARETVSRFAASPAERETSLVAHWGFAPTSVWHWPTGA